MQTDNKLAIVIPAYKAQFLDEALASVAGQTNKNFKLYICDDASSEDISTIAEKYTDQIDIYYHRFPDNLGGRDLVKHWDRCVRLTNAEWIWLFSDDDLMSAGCVQAFFDSLNLSKGSYDLYRFNIEMIDTLDKVILIKEPHPTEETPFQFLKRRLQSKSLSAAIEYIFKKETFIENGGFINLPVAWCADDATWIQFAGTKPIFTIQQQQVYWRSSGINISSSVGFQWKKAIALIGFLQLMLNKFPDKTEDLQVLGKRWLYNSLNDINGRLTLFQSIKLAAKINKLFIPAKPEAFKKLLAFRLKHSRFAGLVQKW